MYDHYDAIVVGAGPAGCSAAALQVLDRMGVLPKIEQGDPWRIDEIAVSSPNGTRAQSPTPHIEGLRDYGYVIPRRLFDATLFEYAATIPTIEAREEVTVKDLAYDGKGVRGISTLQDGRTETVRGAYIIGADGARSIVAERLGLRNEQARHQAIAIRAYFEEVDDLEHTIEMHYESSILPGYGWIFPTGERQANVGVGIFTRFGSAQDIKRRFDRFINNNPYAVAKLQHARMLERSLKGALIPFGSNPGRRHGGNVLLLGDAGSLVDPLTGEGISYALRCGEYAAQAIVAGLRSGDTARAGRSYEKQWQREFRWKEFISGHFFQSLTRHSVLINRAVAKASKNPQRARILMGVIGHQLPKSRLFTQL